MDQEEASKSSESFLSADQSPALSSCLRFCKSRTLDPSQNKEEARPQYLDVGRVNSGETSPTIELKETLELASAYKRIKGYAISSGQECGQALDSVLKRNLSRRLDSIVLVEGTDSSISRQYRARESVITRTPT